MTRITYLVVGNGGEELGGLGSVDGLVTLLPVSRAHLTVLLDVLEGLDETEVLVNVAADRGVVHGDVTNVALGVNEESGAVVVARLHEAAVSIAERTIQISKDRDIHLAKTTLVAGSVGPSEVAEDRVDGSTNDLAAHLAELGSLLGESNDLGGAHEGEVKGICRAGKRERNKTKRMNEEHKRR